MKEAIRNLVLLQKIDLKLDEIEKKKGDLPRMVDELRKNLELSKT